MLEAPRLQLYRYLKKHRLVTCRGLILLNLFQLYPKMSWESNLLKICDVWARSHVHTKLKQLENDEIIQSYREEITGRIGYRITEKHLEEIRRLERALLWRMSQYLLPASA